jgi:PiT family inorganic phosphate transporter
MGVGATKRFSAVRWGVAGKIVLAWVFTLPICFVAGWGIAELLFHI